MFEDKEVAKEIHRLMIEYSEALDSSLLTVQSKCPESEFLAYRDVVAKLMGDAFLDVMTPIYKMHPDLMPEYLKHGRDEYQALKHSKSK